MGLYNLDPNQENQLPLEAPPAFVDNPQQDQPKPFTTEDTKALVHRSAEQNNWFISLYHNGIGDYSKSDPNFNPYEDIKDTKYAEFPEYFYNVDNAQEMEAAKRKVDEKQEYNDLAARAPSLAFWSAMGWGLADPALAIPGYGSVKLARSGNTALKTAAITGAISSGVVAGEEAILQSNQPDRSIAESAANTAATGVVGAALGGIVGGVAARASRPLNKAVKTAAEYQPAPNIEPISTPYSPQYQAAHDAVADVFKVADDSVPSDPSIASRNIARTQDLPNPKELVDSGNYDVNTIPDTVANDYVITDAKTLKALEPNIELEPQSAGAAYVPYYQTHDAIIAGAPDYVIKNSSIPGLPPLSVEGATAPSSVVRDLNARIFRQHLDLVQNTEKGGFQASPISLDSRLDQDVVSHLDTKKFIEDQYIRHLNLDPDKTGHSTISQFKRLPGIRGNYMSKFEFNQEVQKAMESGDKHPIPEVQHSAQYVRNIMNKRWEDLQSVGLKEVDAMQGHFPMVWDVPTVTKNRLGLEDALTKEYMSNKKAIVNYTNDLGEELKTSAVYRDGDKSVDWFPRAGQKLTSVQVQRPLTEREARAAAIKTVDSILHYGDNLMSVSDVDRLTQSRAADAMESRRILATYEAIKPWLVKDFEGVLDSYMHSTSKAHRFKQMLDEAGLDNVQDGHKKIQEEFNAYRQRIRDNASLTDSQKEKAATKLQKQQEISHKTYDKITQMALGTFKKRTKADWFWRTTDQYNASRLLGKVVLSSLGDPTAAFIKNSVPDVLWNGWTSEFRRLLTFTNTAKKKDLRDMGVAIQLELDNMLHSIINPDYEHYAVGKIEKTAQRINQLGMRLNLMAHWNNFWQRANATVAETRILRNLNKGWDNITTREKRYLANLGIDKPMSEAIAEMQQRYGYDLRGTHISNVKAWSPTLTTKNGITGRKAKEAFENAIMLETNKSPIITERGDYPAFIQKSQFRKSAFLFKGFPSAGTTKLFLSMVTRHDHRALTGLVALVGMGAMSYIIKEKLKGKEPDLSTTNIIRQGMDQSGVLGLLGSPLFQGMQTHDSIRKYGARASVPEPIDYILGPNSSIVSPVYRAIMAKATGAKLDNKTKWQIHALQPYQNLWWLKSSYNKSKPSSSLANKRF